MSISPSSGEIKRDSEKQEEVVKALREQMEKEEKAFLQKVPEGVDPLEFAKQTLDKQQERRGTDPERTYLGDKKIHYDPHSAPVKSLRQDLAAEYIQQNAQLAAQIKETGGNLESLKGRIKIKPVGG